MIDPDDLTIEPNDDDVCDDYWGCDDDDDEEETEEEKSVNQMKRSRCDDRPESDNPYYDGT